MPAISSHIHHPTSSPPATGSATTSPATTNPATASPAATGSAATGPVIDPAWQVWSTAWTAQITILTGRSDLTVTVAPGAGHGAPACYIPSTAAVEVDANLIGDPTITNPRKPGHKNIVPAVYGALVHEAAHAVHSRWTSPPGTAPILDQVAQMLEESRAERQHRRRRPRDRQWIRHCVTTIVAAGDAPTDTLFNAAYAAGILLARVDAGILTPTDVRTLRQAVTPILGRKRLARLRRIWRSTHMVDDTDAHTMIEYARQWCHTLGIDPDTAPQPPDPHAGTATSIADAIGDVIAAASTPTPSSTPTTRTPGTPPGLEKHEKVPASWTVRPPTIPERQAAVRLTGALRRARTREPVTTRQPSATPPGRLRTREAVNSAAQRASGAVPTAQPWQRTVRRAAPEPDLTVAVLVDVSGSMGAFAAPMSATAWILAHAAHKAGAHTATIAFGSAVTIITAPGRAPAQVRDIRADAATERFDDAVTIADRLLHLSTPGTARLAVIVSDGQYYSNGLPEAQATITRLITAGCAVLCLTPDTTDVHTYTGPTTVAVTDPADCAALIGRAATRALTHR